MATPAPPYRVRITDPVVHMLRPGDITDHPLQHKSHPPQQREAMAALCREIGIAGVLLVYHSPGNAGALTALDGHLRKSLDPSQPWPCVLLDVDDDEAAYLLLTHDEIGRLAELLRLQTTTLLERVRTQEGAVQDLLRQIEAREGWAADGAEGAGNGAAGLTPRASLADVFLVPPFSVLDARQGYWQNRKRAWLALGIQSELGRGGGGPDSNGLLGESQQVRS